ncbi:hypothetical protein [Vibrio phage phiKT1024]|nr:hypothetical protein [Vibrio phage phiKT1024]
MNPRWSDVSNGEFVVYTFNRIQNKQYTFISKIECVYDDEIACRDKIVIGELPAGWLKVKLSFTEEDTYHSGDSNFVLLGRDLKDEDDAMNFIRQKHPELLI